MGESAGGPSQLIPALQPDLLGEWFVLSAIANGLPGEEILNLAWQQGPEQTAAFLHRLSQDFPEHAVTAELLHKEPPNDQARKAFAGISASILVNLHEARCPFPAPVIVGLIAAANSAVVAR